MTLQAIKYSRGKLEILNQLKLPHEEVYDEISSPREAWDAIKSMRVRGAPAIAIVAILSLAVWGAKFLETETKSVNVRLEKSIPQFLSDNLKYLVTSRPTAVNLAEAANRFDKIVWDCCADATATGVAVIEAYIKAAEKMLTDDINDNQNIGRFGAEWILQKSDPSSQQKISLITHCNTGSLATASYGTALGVIRSLHTRDALDCAFYTETRPYNQGSRLTGYELIHDQIPAVLVTDSMVAALLHRMRETKNIAAIIVGADRVAANGDTANKIGTYSLAIIARHHQVKFIVAAPRTTIDLSTKSGSAIVIEERSTTEMTTIKGRTLNHMKGSESQVATDRTAEISIAAPNTKGWNPAFDVTPAKLIDAIVTEVGVIERDKNDEFNMAVVFDNNS